MMRFSVGVLIGAAALTLLGAVACAPPPTAQSSTEIAEKAEVWAAAMNAADVDGLVALYSNDARLMPPNGEIGQGAEAVREMFGGMIAEGLKVELETVEAMTAGDLGYRLGTYKLVAGDVEVDHGKYIETWRKGADGWRISNDIWNSDVALPVPGTVTLAAVHEVKNADKWIAAWQGDNSRKDWFAQHGVTNARIFQSKGQPNLTGVVFDVNDPASFEAFMATPEAAAAKAEDGVIDKTLRILAEVK